MFVAMPLLAQKVKVDVFNKSYEKYRNSNHFDYVHEDFDTTKLTWVADLTVKFDTVIPGMIGESFKLLKNKANRFGANSFQVSESDIYTEGNDKFISIKIFWLRMEDRATNDSLFRSTDVYLFGLLGHHQEIEGYEVSLGDDSFTMHALSCRKHSYQVGEEILLQLGTKVRGASVQIKIREYMYPKFYYFSMLRGSFKNATIQEYPLEYGLFLSKILSNE
jgi:hypothetical protein